MKNDLKDFYFVSARCPHCSKLYRTILKKSAYPELSPSCEITGIDLKCSDCSGVTWTEVTQ